MDVVDLIRKKRDGHELNKNDLEFLVSGYIKNIIPDYQFSAILMAVYLKGMSFRETSVLTSVMLDSGKVLNIGSIPDIKIDKHSTGGVGDKTSLIVTPVAAAAGVKIPMISGRGLGHTGGTLDKLESIPGFRTNLSGREIKKVLKNCNAVFIGQSKNIVPADKMIYAIRDVTATVESIPLITSSIMSKKLAEGIDGLVLDIKTGNGAFMQKMKDAVKLTGSLTSTAKAYDKNVIAFITDMNQPLGKYIGNWLEVFESILILKEGRKNDLYRLSVKLAGAMIYLGKKARNLNEGIKIAEKKLHDRSAFEKLLEIVKEQGGDIEYLKNPEKYPEPSYKKIIKSPISGYLKSVNTFELGMASVKLGAGRLKKNDTIDPKAGIIFNFKIGDKIKQGDVIAKIFSDNKKSILDVEKRFINMIEFANKKVNPPKLIKKIIEEV